VGARGSSDTRVSPRPKRSEPCSAVGCNKPTPDCEAKTVEVVRNHEDGTRRTLGSDRRELEDGFSSGKRARDPHAAIVFGRQRRMGSRRTVPEAAAKVGHPIEDGAIDGLRTGEERPKEGRLRG